MKKGRIKFRDIFGKSGIKYDEWLDKQPEGYYLTYKQNFYSDEYDFSIEREGFVASEPVLLATKINVITKLIDNEMKKEKMKNRDKER